MAEESRGEVAVLEGKKGLKARLNVAASVRHLLSPCSTATLALRMGLLTVLWFSVSFVYYGIALNATNIRQENMNLTFSVKYVNKVFRYSILCIFCRYL